MDERTSEDLEILLTSSLRLLGGCLIFGGGGKVTVLWRKFSRYSWHEIGEYGSKLN